MVFILFLCLLSSHAELPLHAQRNAPLGTSKEDVEYGLRTLDNLFASKYALKSWKKRLYGWTHSETRDKLLNSLQSEDRHLSTLQAQNYFEDYILSARDQHLHVDLRNAIYRFLPFAIEVVEERFFVRISTDPNIEVGDEILTINDLAPLDYAKKNRLMPQESIQEALQKAQKKKGGHSPQTKAWLQQATHRECNNAFWQRAITVTPPAPGQAIVGVNLQVKVKKAAHTDHAGQEETHCTRLQRQPCEFVTPSWSSLSIFSSQTLSFGEKTVSYIKIPTFLVNNDYLLKSLFDPDAVEKAKEDVAEALYRSYSHKLYLAACDARKSNAIILDLRGNPGGYNHTLNFWLSFFIDTPIPSAVTVDKNNAYGLKKKKDDLRDLKYALNCCTTNLSKILEDPNFYDLHDFVRSGLQFHSDFFDYEQASLDIYETTYLEGKKKLCVGSNTCTRKPAKGMPPMPPLYILIDNQTGSAAEIFSASLQSAGAAKTAGSLTRGATGALVTYETHSCQILKAASITSDFLLIPENSKLKIIEDIGVVPDIDLRPTLEDINTSQSTLFNRLTKRQLFKEKDLVLHKLLMHINQSEIDNTSIVQEQK